MLFYCIRYKLFCKLISLLITVPKLVFWYLSDSPIVSRLQLFNVCINWFLFRPVIYQVNVFSVTSLQIWGQFKSGIDYLKKNGIGIEKFWVGIEVSYKKIKSRNKFTIFTMLTLHVVLPIYCNHNDPELWFLLYIYIYIYMGWKLTVGNSPLVIIC